MKQAYWRQNRAHNDPAENWPWAFGRMKAARAIGRCEVPEGSPAAALAVFSLDTIANSPLYFSAGGTLEHSLLTNEGDPGLMTTISRSMIPTIPVVPESLRCPFCSAGPNQPCKIRRGHNLRRLGVRSRLIHVARIEEAARLDPKRGSSESCTGSR